MAKQDFARKRRSGSSASRKPARQPARQPAPRRAAPPPRRTPWGLLLVTLVVLGGLGALVYTLLQTPPETAAATTAAEAPKPTVKPKPAPAPKPAPTPVPEPEPEKSRFEFYEMLPKAEVVAPKVDTYKSTPKDAKMEHRYLLQAGSFRDPGDAERMRARLILQGFSGVRTDRSDGSNGVWYRVRLGPFDNKAEMNAAQNKLGKLSILPMAIRID